jgi:hypothetical protein
MSILAILTCVTLVLGVVLSATAFHRDKHRQAMAGAGVILASSVVLWLGFGATLWVLLFGLVGMALAFPRVTNLSAKWRAIVTAVTASATLFVAAPAIGLTGTPSHTASVADVRDAGNPSDLAIKPGELLPDAAKCPKGDEFNQNSMPGTPGRLWSDSVSTPFKAGDKDAQFKELTSEICVNPTLLDAYIKALNDAQIGDFSVGAHNTWMKEFLDKSSGKDGLKVWLTHKASDPKGIYVTGTDTGQFQYYAQLTNAVLYVLDNQGAKTATSNVHWPLGSLVADTLPRVYKETDPNKQESKPFLALTFTTKAGGCPYVLGVNLMDKRPENFPCEVAKTIAPPTPTKSKPPVIPGHPTPTPTTPGHTPTPTTTPSTPPATCVWSNGTVHNLDHGVCPKDPNPIPSNTYHTPAGHPTQPASQPSHPAQTANPSTKPGSGSTQTAPGATAAPQPTKSAPPAGDPTSTATTCIPDPDTGTGC